MRNMEKLTKTVQKNGKMRMLLMYAIADDCKESIALSANDDYTTSLLSAAVDQHKNLNLTSEQLDECAGVILRTIESIDFSGTNSKKERLVVLEKGLKSEITERVKDIISNIPETLDIEGINKLSVDTVDSVILWMLVRDVIHHVPVCKDTIKAASSYKKQNAKQKPEENVEPSSVSSDDVQATMEAFSTAKYAKISYNKLSKKDKNILKGIAGVLETEYATAIESIIKNPLDDKSAEQKAVQMATAISEKIETPHTLELVRDCYNSETSSDVSLDVLLVSVVYSEYVIAMHNKVFGKGRSANLPALFNGLKQPGFSSLILATKYNDVKIDDAIKELNHLYTITKLADEEDSVKNEIITVATVEPIEEDCGATSAEPEKTSKLKFRRVKKEKVSKAPKKLSEMNFIERRIELIREKHSEFPSEVKIALLSGRL